MPVEAFYRFNGFCATYWWRLAAGPNALVRVGATLNVRDACADVRQAGRRNVDSNIGPVPLAFLQVDQRLGPHPLASVEQRPRGRSRPM